jgi:serine/threonine protein phosphatase PrpC
MAALWRGEGGQEQGARPYQEDSWALRTLSDGTLLAVIADGMGGHAGGAVASRLVVDAFLKAVESLGRPLADGLREANAAVKAGAAGKTELAGMGATLVGALVKGDEVRWISVGDSPLYLVADGKVERLNADHSFAPQIDAMVARGMITAEEAAHHPGRHTLREAVMGEPLTLIDEGTRQMGAAATLLLCSDGVESLARDRIAVAATRPVQHLLDMVLAVGKPHQDNVTIIKLDRQA